MKFRYPFLVLYFALAVQTGLAQNTYVPDNNFEQALIDLNYDDTLDDSVLTANISGVTNLDVREEEISDLTGIEDFTSLTVLYCYNNQLTSLDISANTALTTVYCEYNALTSLDVSANTALTNLNCTSNALTSLDVSNNTALTYLDCRNNQLTTLDVSTNTALTTLWCKNNQLTSLDVSGAAALEDLQCQDNQLTSLDVSANTALTHLNCGNNQLTSLNVSSNTALEELHNHNNQLTSLDLSSNTALTYLTASNNPLTALDVSANTALTTLKCTDTQLTALDVSANTALTLILSNGNSLTSLDVSANTALTDLNVSDNQLTSLDVSANTALDDFRCYNNQLTALDVSNNTALTNLTCGNNPLSSLDVSNNTALTELECWNNSLTNLDVSNNTLLTDLGIHQNNLTSVDLSSNTALQQLTFATNGFTSIDLSSNTLLTFLNGDECDLTALDVSANTALTTLRCNNNQLTTLDMSANTALTHLYCNENQLTSLDVSTNTALTHLYFGGNQLTSLDVSSNTALLDLNFPENQLTSLDVSSNTNLFWLNCGLNQLTSLDVSSNTALTGLLCSNNQLTYLNMKNGVTDAYTHFSAQTNDLTCIETLDPAYATANWTYANGNIDAGVTFDVICGAAARTNWHVATTGSDITGSGTLASPLSSIQTAINAATVGDTVSVAAGTYVENINFSGKNIAVIGADSSNTIIDGDSSGSVVTFNNGEDTTAVLKNFTIQNGFNTWGGGVYISSSSPTITNINVVNNNVPNSGGGIHCQESSSPSFSNMTISGNTSGSAGGGLYCLSNSEPTLTNVTITNNTSSGTGGGIYAENSSFTMDSVTVSNNTSSNMGGGIYSYENSESTIKNSFISNNTSSGVGGGLTSYRTPIIIYNTVIDSNESTNESGGGIYIDQTPGAGVRVIDSKISNNVANQGGGIYFHGKLILVNSYLTNNAANEKGGGFVSCCGSDVTMDNVTITGNTTNNPAHGNGLLITGSSANQISVANSIIWGNDFGNITFDQNGEGADGHVLNVNYSLVGGGQDSITTNGNTINWGSGNTDADPLFTDAANGDYTLQSGSPAIDVGNPNAFYNDTDGTRNDMGYTGGNGITLSATDIDFGYLGVGDTRNKTLTVTNSRNTDISVSGASFDDAQFSTSTSFPVTVAAYSAADVTLTFTPSTTGAHADTLQLSSNDIPGSNTYGEFALSGNAFDLSDGVVQVPGEVPTIQGAIDAASDGDTVLVAAGTYYENINFNGKNIAVIGADSSNTIIDGDSSGIVVTFNSGEDTTAVLKNFTIQNGYNNDPSTQNFRGGGIFISSSSAKLEYLNVTNNSAGHGGGIMHDAGGYSIIRNTTVSGNFGQDRGGGLCLNSGGTYVITNVTVSGNTSDGPGGGIRIDGNAVLKNVTVVNNTANYNGGGGIYTDGGTLTIYSSNISNNSSTHGGGIATGSSGSEFISVYNSTISGNTSSGSGGGFSGVGCGLMMNNVQITDNTSSSNNGGGLYLQTVYAVLNNVTVANNTANNGGGLYVCCNGATNIDNSIYYNNYPQEIKYSNNNANIINVSYSIIEGGQNPVVLYSNDSLYWGSGNIDANPLFTDTTNGNYTLRVSSPAVNVGNPNGFYNDSDGSRNDMGYTGGNGLIVTTFDVFGAGGPIPRITPLEIDYGNVGIGNTAPTENFYIYNTRTDSVIFGSYSTTDNQFTVTNPSLPVTIQSFEKRSLNLQFLATSSGDQTSTIELSFSNLSNNNGSFSAVGTAYDVPAGNINVPADVPTIQLAIDIAPYNKTIVVAPGEYFENITGKSNISLTSSGGPLQTTINGNNEGIVIEGHINSTYNFTLEGFTITGGNGANYEHGVSAINLKSGITLRNLIITGNSGWGNVIQVNPEVTLIENVAIFDNVDSGTYTFDAAVYIHGAGSDDEYCVIKNVTIANNEGMYGISYDGIDNAHDLNVINSCIWGNDQQNADAQIVFGHTPNNPSYQINVRNSLVEGGPGSISFSGSGTGQSNNASVNWDSSNLTSYPYFNDQDNGDYSLSTYSPMIGAGVSSVTIGGITYEAPNTDIIGNSRPNPAGTSPDIGAYESSESVADYNPHKYVTTTGNNSGPGTLDQPFLTIQYAIDQAQDDDIIHVAVGTYLENINYNGKNISVIGEDRETTIIDGDSSGTVVLFSGGEDSTALLKSFTIQNGSGYYTSSDREGGGIYIKSSNPTLDNLIISENVLEYSSSSNPSPNGGGIMIDDADGISLTNIIINENFSWNLGGGIYIKSSTADLENVSIINNQTDNQGGGIYSNGSYLNLTNVLIADNYLRNDGSGSAIYSWNDGSGSAGSLTIINCTVVNNTGGTDEILTNLNPAPIIYNSIIFGSLGWGAEYELYYSYCEQCDNLNNYTNNPGNINTYPAFVDSSNGDYHLSDLSPAIGAGAASITIDGTTYTVPSNDLDGNPRPNPAGTLPDMGAYESDKGVDPNYAGPVWYVDGPAGLPYGNGGPGAPFTTIQAGIDAASNGDTVSVKAGTYVETIGYSDKRLSIIGADRETTIIDGNSTGSVVEIGVNANNSVLSNFTVQNGTETGTTYGWGSGIYAQGNIILDNLIVKNNTNSSAEGAGIFLDGASNPTIKNCLIIDNTGDGIVCNASNPLIYNVTIVNNSEAGIYLRSSPHPTIVNSIIHGNLDNNQIHFGSSGIVDISYCLVEEGQDSIAITVNDTLNWGSGNIDVDPMFVDTANGNYHLLASSMLINAGHPDSTDSDGSSADIGAYPYLNSYSGPTWYIAENGNDTTATGASNDPFRSIQAGINFSSSGDSVTVAAGTYVENLYFPGKNIDVIGANRETTIIDGDSSGSVVTFSSWHSSTTVFSGFTVQNGNNNDGGGILVDGTSPTLSNLIIKNNAAVNSGGGIAIKNSDLLLTNSVIKGNSSESAGGILIVNNSLSTISNVEITGNNPSHGSAVYIQGSDPVISNATIANNKSYYVNNNEKGIELYHGANLTLINSIITDQNYAPIKISGGDSSFIAISYSLIEGGLDSIVTSDNGAVTWGSSNIDVDPMFVDTANGNYHLLASSQLINAGHPDSTDSDGSRADIGAYSYSNNYTGPTWYIAESGNDTTATGSSTDPFRSIQAGINFSSDADSVTVAAGTYVENINFKGRNIKVVGANRETTIIDGNQSGAVVAFGKEDQATLSGFTVMNGSGNNGYADPIDICGGGIFISRNAQSGVGNISLMDLIISNNIANTGSGVYIYEPTGVIIDNVIIKDNNLNDGSAGGGGIFTMNANLLVKNSIIDNNDGEGIRITQGSEDKDYIFVNNLIINNNDGFYFSHCEPLLDKVTITNNLSDGIVVASEGNATIINSCITFNPLHNIAMPTAVEDTNVTVDISYSNVGYGQDGIDTDNGTIIWGTGNIDVDPMFVDTANGDYTLQMDSPLIDAGHPDSTDGDGTRADIGAYYYDQSGQPARVQGFMITPADSSEILLTWDALSPGPDHYSIYRSTDMNADFYSLNPHISSVAGNAITIIDDNQVTEDITYYYRIRGIDAEGDEGLLALLKHGRLGSDSTSLYMQDAFMNHTTGSGLDAGSSYTLEAFMRFPAFPTDPINFIIFGSDFLQLVPLVNDQVRIDLHLSGTDYEGIAIADTSWHHVALTTDGSTTTLWVDGYAAVNATAVFTVNNRMLQFGNSASTSLSIRIDDARLSNSVRYSSGFIPVAGFSVDANTLGYWAFDEGSTDDQTPATYDRSGNGLHLSIEHEGSDVVSWYTGVPVVDISSSPLVINEIMQNPSEVSDPQGEWIEIYNTYFTPLYLKDYVLSDDGSDDHTITSAVVVPAGGYAVLASNADTATNAGLIADYEFSGFSLGNSTDEVLLSDPNGVEIDRVAYDNGTTFPDPDSASMELIAPHYDNSLGNSWTVAVTEYGAGDFGSPGRRNDAFSGAIVLSDSVFSFGGAVEGNELVNTLNISNTGVRPLTISTISSTLAEFTISTSSAVVPIGDTLALAITFTPTGPGLYQDTLLIVSDDPVHPNTRVPLEAFGISEAADITIASAASDSLATFGFPLTRIGSPRTTTFSVSNIGAEALEIDEITFTGDVNGFTVDQSSIYLELYDTVWVVVTFDPPVNGPYAATLGFSSNDPDEALYNIAFTGTGSQYIIFEVPNEIPTIQAALDTALAGDTVNVAAGTYGGELVFPANDLVLRGSSQETTILNGGDSSVVLTVNSGQTSVSIISGFTIRGGLGTNGGGVVVDNGASPVFNQIIFYDNGAAQGAAIYVNSFSNPTISRSTFVVNSASSGQGGGIAVAGGSSVTVTSSIFWANTGTAVEVLSGSADITYSIVEGGDAGTGNLDQNPLFVNPGTGDFHIQWGSPAIDGGDPASPPDPDGTSADMGALYYDQTLQPPNAPTGLSFTAAIDHVTLSWTANSEADLVSYIIYSGLSAETLDSVSLVLDPNTTYEDFTIDPAVPVYYQVAAVDTGALMGNRSTVLEVSYPVIATSSGSVDFGSVRFLQSVEQIIYFYNHGSLELNIDSIFVQADVGFSVSIGGLVLQTGTPAGGTSMLPITPLTPGRGTGDINQDKPLSHNPGKENAPEIHSRAQEGFTINPGDSMEISITFTSADTGSFATNLVAQNDDPITNVLNVSLTAHAVAPGIELVRTMSVVTYLNNDITFDVAVQNPGGYPLDYTVTAEANYFGFEWLTISQGTGQVPGYTTGTLTVNVTNTANLDAAGYQGYLYFNTNTSSNPDAMVPTDTIDVYMTLLADGSQISDGDVTVPSGNAPLINVVDDGGTDMGLMLDFINSSGGSITVTRIDAQPPADASTAFTDPSGTITNPIYARRYYEINATISGSFAVDIGFDYATLAGILDPAALRLAKRSLNAGTGEEWTIIPSASTTLNATDGLVVASNQTGFSQWTILSNVGENTFIDMQAPTVASTSVNPTQPGILEGVTVTATINDETGISSATLYYTSGGSAVFTSTAMSGTGSAWSALIPGAEVSRNGIIYYISATDPLAYSALSDTFGVAVTFPAGDLTTSSVSGSGYSGGLPIDKWRLLAVPAVLTTATVAGVIGDELGAQSSATWRMFRYDQNTSTYKENPNNFTPGEAYWIYQRVEDNLVLTAPGGETGSMDGTSLTIVPGWNLISSPYPFLIDAALNQTLFYGPVTYGVSGESWTDVQTKLIPWSGYALYNRTANNQAVTLDPIASTNATLARTVQKEGWLMNLAVSAGVYADHFNQLGRIIGAEDGLDYFDNPELLPPGEYLSLVFSLPEYRGKTAFTSDLRSPGNDAAVWTANIRAKGLSETATLSWAQLQSFERNEAVRIIDRQTRTVVDPLSVSNLYLGRINERFPRVLDLVVGDPVQVEKLVKEILASLPEEFSLKQNYPNPFNPVTTIQFGLPQPANVRLTIVNILGQEVTELVNDWRDMGFHQVRWAGVNDQGLAVSTGVYFSILTDGQQVQIRKMLLVK